MLPRCYAATNLPGRHLLVAGTQRSRHEGALASRRSCVRDNAARFDPGWGDIFLTDYTALSPRLGYTARVRTTRRPVCRPAGAHTDGEEEKPWKTTWPRIAAAPVDPARAERSGCSPRRPLSESPRAPAPATSASSATSCS